MKNITTYILMLLLISCIKEEFNQINNITDNEELEFDYEITRNHIRFNWRSNGYPSSNHAISSIRDVSPALIYEFNEQTYMINGGVTDDESGESIFSSQPSPLLKLIKDKDNIWSFSKVYTDIFTWTVRSHKFMGNSVALQDGNEIGNNMTDWKGDIWFSNINSLGNLSWVKVNQDEYKGYMHGVGAGDINGDGLVDLAGAPGYWNEKEKRWQMALFIQNTDESFSWAGDIFEYDSSVPFAVDLVDLTGDGKAEIIFGDYGAGDPSEDDDLNQIRVYKYDETYQKFNLLFKSSQSDKLWNVGMGATQTRVYDFNNDGILDITNWRDDNSGSGFDIFLGNTEGEYNPHFSNFFPIGTHSGSCEFEVFDANNDGFLDILLVGNGDGSNFRINPYSSSDSNNGIILNQLIWINNGDGTFNYPENLNLEITQPDQNFNFNPQYVIPYKYDDNLHFLALPKNINNNGDIISYDIYDIKVFLN